MLADNKIGQGELAFIRPEERRSSARFPGHGTAVSICTRRWSHNGADGGGVFPSLGIRTERSGNNCNGLFLVDKVGSLYKERLEGEVGFLRLPLGSRRCHRETFPARQWYRQRPPSQSTGPSRSVRLFFATGISLIASVLFTEIRTTVTYGLHR